ncbi:MAG: hypothetical protein R3D80_21220 [Paracoccaceae bacterium]
MNRACAQEAEGGGDAIKEAVTAGAREIDAALAGRDAMELEIVTRFPGSRNRAAWVGIRSNIDTDGAHKPATGPGPSAAISRASPPSR